MNRFDLYTLAVQSPLMEARFLDAVHGDAPRTLGEDFCGPGAVARAWLQLGNDRHAICVDLDDEPLTHLRARLHDELPPEAQQRLTIRQTDVRACTDPVDVIAALNFGIGELHTRDALLAYLQAARERLATQGGVLVVDIYAGPSAFVPGATDVEIETDSGTIVYTWEQASADPLTGRVQNRIHFHLPDGRVLRDAFAYDWRLWSIPEIREAMTESGFASTDVYTSYGDAMDGDGNLLVRPATADDLEPDEDLVAYIVGRTDETA